MLELDFGAVDTLTARIPAGLDHWLVEFIKEAWIFPSPKDPAKPCDRHLLDNWLRHAYQLAGMEPKQGSLWRAFRRKWATERKHLPLADVAAAEGWKNSITLQLVYQRIDPETIRNVVHSPNRLRASG